LPQEAQSCSGEVGGNDEELACRPDFDDRFGFSLIECDSVDNALDFSCPGVSLTLDDFTREDDVFEVKDRDVVIVKFLCCMNGYDIVERADTFSNSVYSRFCHSAIPHFVYKLKI